MEVSVTNVGDGPLIFGDYNPRPPSPFAIDDDACGKVRELPVGASCTIRYGFYPVDTNPVSATAKIRASDRMGNFVTVKLTGTGTVPASGSIVVSASELNFGSVPVDQSASRNLTITNTGSGPLRLFQIANPGTPFSRSADDCSNNTLASGASCTVGFEFSPTAAGVQSAKIPIGSSDPNSRIVTFRLTGNGTTSSVPGSIAISATELNFGAVQPDDSIFRKLTVTNTGSGPLEMFSVSEPTEPFRVTNDECSGNILAAGGTCLISFEFTPGEEGDASSSVDIGSSDPQKPIVTLSLVGTGSNSPQTLQFESLSSPDLGANSELTINGQGFNTAKKKVLIGPKKAKILDWSNTAIRTRLPALSAGTYPVKVVTKKNGSVDASEITVHLPFVASLGNASASPGDTITVTGQYFGARKPKVFLVSGDKRRAAAVLPGFSDGAVDIKIPRRIKADTYQVVVHSSAGNSAEDVRIAIE